MIIKKYLIIITVSLVLVSLAIITSCSTYRYENRIKIIVKNSKYKVMCRMEHKMLEKEDYNIHYFVSGKENSDLIILLHPAFSDHRVFNQQIDFFSKNHRVIAIDLLGHGLSKGNKSKDKIDASATHINEIMKIEGFEKAHLVGVSMGSLIAQYFTLNYPEKTKSLTALGGYNIHKENKEVAKAQRSVNLKLVIRAVFSMKSFRKKTSQQICKSEEGQALFYETTSHYERKSFMVMQGLQNVIKDRKSIKPQYPTMILIGEFDIDLSIKMAKEWHSRIDNSQYFMIENAGHCANIDKPLEFNRIIEEFIEENN